jgi:hypothetical protein
MLCLAKTKSTFAINNKERDVTMLHAMWLGEITIRHRHITSTRDGVSRQQRFGRGNDAHDRLAKASIEAVEEAKIRSVICALCGYTAWIALAGLAVTAVWGKSPRSAANAASTDSTVISRRKLFVMESRNRTGQKRAGKTA